eukprot:CAMPEP_0206481820 /NCGR_PEP_ID=MMETSP0324_2-20121206/38414_1 /ASSEMBLY_ACC=CAM_ASM_000836 /TAXON_ID=2866 /ORGANISM="Crypthecodinium cohnii, Strain Seligo" /LENGTH=59 /DNA_ID=CAMNT_0053959465 /DNA_START=232 /DNA_END=412 /DNA_ORIENTATION=-
MSEAQMGQMSPQSQQAWRKDAPGEVLLRWLQTSGGTIRIDDDGETRTGRKQGSARNAMM